MARTITCWSNRTTLVCIDWRSFGGVSMTDMSRMPASDMFRVRGIGVAVIVNTSTRRRSCLMRSLWATPNRCSSSTINSPRSLNRTSFESSRWVPTMTSTLPASRSARVCFCSARVRNRLTRSMRTGNAANRSVRVLWCWNARTVVGARKPTCLPSITALNPARIATSVLPYPTSPQSSRSIATVDSMSFRISAIADCWSVVSSYSNASWNSRCQWASGLNACPGIALRAAYSFRSSSAMSRIARRTRVLVLAQEAPPSRSRAFAVPEYFCSRSICCTGTNSLSCPA